MLRIAILLGWLLCFQPALLAQNPGSPPAQVNTQAQQLDPLLDLMQARLDLAPEVARTKWNQHAPLEDPAREEQILAQLPVIAGLDPELARSFFKAQMEASKTVQRQLYQQWQQLNQPPFPSARPLSELRPGLDRLTRPLLEALAQAQPQLEEQARLAEVLQKRFGDELTPAWQQAVDPLWR